MSKRLTFEFLEGTPAKGRILDSAGNDLAGELHCTKAVITITPGEVITAVLTCVLPAVRVTAETEIEEIHGTE